MVADIEDVTGDIARKLGYWLCPEEERPGYKPYRVRVYEYEKPKTWKIGIKRELRCAWDLDGSDKDLVWLAALEFMVTRR